MSAATQTHSVDPARLNSGRWCHRAERMIGEGDISASYSADRIGSDEPGRKPFSWKGGLWVCVSIAGRAGELRAEAYRLVHPQIFDGEPVTYGARRALGDAARNDPNGFYHGMLVRRGKDELVLCGPPVLFVPGQTEQLALF